MKYGNIEEIRNELENTIIGFFREKQDGYWHMHAWEKYTAIEETVSFLFEEHKDDFNQLIGYTGKLSDDTKELEQKLFISWTALSAYHSLNAIGVLYETYKNN